MEKFKVGQAPWETSEASPKSFKVGQAPWDEPEESGLSKAGRNVEAGVMQVTQGLAGNLGDEVAGGVEAAGRAVGLKGLGGSFSDIEVDDDGPTLDWEILRNAYKAARDKKRGVLNKQSEEFPVASMAGNIAGAVASPINKITKGMSLAKGGMALGGINAFGASDAEDVSGLALDTGIGVAGGGVLGKAADEAAPYLQAGVEKTGQALKSGAEWMGARALGAERGTIKELGADKVKALGRYALDEGILSPLASTDDLVARNMAKQSDGGRLMGQVYDKIDDAGVSTFNPQQAASEVDDQLGGFFRSPINKGETQQFENTLESILARGEGNIAIKEAQALKEELNKVANWKNKLTITDKERMARDAYGIVSKQIDDAVDAGAQVIGSDDLLSTLQQGKKLFGSSKDASKLLENKQAREQGNKMLGLTDYGILGGGLPAAFMTGGTSIAPTLAAVGVKKGLEKYGSQSTAIGLDKLSKQLLKSPRMLELYQKNPAAFQSLASKFEQQMGSSSQTLPRAAEQPEAQNFNEKNDKSAVIQKLQGTKYGKVLENAAANGDESYSAAYFVLSQRDPEFRKTIGDDK